ncbi:MAG: riboflavin biosynthesis protein RibD [Deltaproteobacteria bacterium RBG_13_65_10]|nr:MAG: riboflavin biosynthesis protein RibD [Deltaproteobacteria bacterium RBG_13_65_10]
MRRALALARRGEGWTGPNPMVGALVVRGGRVVGQGWHRRAGEAHAEVIALRRAGRFARGATLYVTLEPCNHAGRTPPCTDAIIARGVGRVVIGMSDPNARVRGGGARRLREKGIEVARGVLESDCRAMNAAFVKHATTGRPLVSVKCAVSLDGKVAFGRGRAGRISGPEANRYVHRLRHASDAILVGVETVRVDDPRLTTRRSTARGRTLAGQDPLRVILDGRLRTPPRSRLLHGASPAGTVIATTTGAPRRSEALLRAAGAEVWRFPSRDGRVDLDRVLRELGRCDVQSVLIEGGPRVVAYALARGLVDRVAIIVAPLLVGGDRAPGLLAEALAKPLNLENLRVRRLGADLLIEADLPRP